MKEWRSPRVQFGLSLIVSSLVSIVLFGYGALKTHSWGFTYLTWNLFLAWIPLLLTIRLIVVLRHKLWSSWEALLTTIIWLLFLPNSFYMISDFIHLNGVNGNDVLYDAIMFSSFIFTGVTVGFVSLFLTHVQLRRRLSANMAALCIAGTLFICSVAVYVGRDLRWNSWAIITNPGGLLFDLSNRAEHPEAYPQMITTIVAFFLLLGVAYGLLWHGAKLFSTRRDDLIKAS